MLRCTSCLIKDGLHNCLYSYMYIQLSRVLDGHAQRLHLRPAHEIATMPESFSAAASHPSDTLASSLGTSWGSRPAIHPSLRPLELAWETSSGLVEASAHLTGLHGMGTMILESMLWMRGTVLCTVSAQLYLISGKKSLAEHGGTNPDTLQLRSLLVLLSSRSGNCQRWWTTFSAPICTNPESR